MVSDIMSQCQDDMKDYERLPDMSELKLMMTCIL